MSHFKHSNVMTLIGVCIDCGPSPYIVMPYMAYGSLLSYLKKNRAELTVTNDNDTDLVRLSLIAFLMMLVWFSRRLSLVSR